MAITYTQGPEIVWIPDGDGGYNKAIQWQSSHDETIYQSFMDNLVNREDQTERDISNYTALAAYGQTQNEMFNELIGLFNTLPVPPQPTP